MARFSTAPLEEVASNGTGKRGRKNRTGINWSDREAVREYHRERYRRNSKGEFARVKASMERNGRVWKTLALDRTDAAWVTEYGDGNFNEGVRRLIAEVRTTREEADVLLRRLNTAGGRGTTQPTREESKA